MKYRIVSRNKYSNGDYSPYKFYYAQVEVFGTWFDCRLNPFISTFDSYDTDLKVVEKWVENRIKPKERIEDVVVKIYD